MQSGPQHQQGFSCRKGNGSEHNTTNDVPAVGDALAAVRLLTLIFSLRRVQFCSGAFSLSIDDQDVRFPASD